MRQPLEEWLRDHRARRRVRHVSFAVHAGSGLDGTVLLVLNPRLEQTLRPQIRLERKAKGESRDQAPLVILTYILINTQGLHRLVLIPAD
jgi:hypothetical protein